MANRNNLTLIDSSTRYPFTIFKKPDAPERGYQIKTRDWETGDPIGYWKKPLHPWDAGIVTDRITHNNGYRDANADLSNKGLLVPPPKLQLPTDAFQEIKVVDTNGGEANGTAADHIDINIEGGVSVGNLREGDIIVATVVCVDADAKTIANSVGGMTALTQIDNNNFSMRSFYKSYAGTPVATYTFTFGATIDTFEVVYAVLRGGTFRTSATASDSTTPYTTPSVTLAEGETVIGIAARTGGSISAVPTGYTEIATILHTDGLSWAYKSNNSAGATTADFTGSGSSDGGTVAIVITPATPVFATVTSNTKFVNFNSKLWFFDETGLYSLGTSNRLVRELYKTTITDIEAFNNELIIAYGYSTKISKLTAADPEVYTTASDNTYAGKLTVVGSNLWRSTSTTGVSSCTSTPLTLSNWGATYTVGDSTYDINVLIDYGGALWVGKPNGFFTADINTDFWNQTPQLAQWPDTDNCKGAFVAKGYLWCPSLSGLLRIRQGESLRHGPEVVEKYNDVLYANSGIEWAGNIYLVCVDSVDGGGCIIKMVDDEGHLTEHDYIYHQWVKIATNANPFRLGININTGSTPCLIIATYGGLKFIDMGFSLGRQIDDNNYFYGAAWTFEIGSIRPTDDLSLITGLLGLEIVTDQNSAESITTIQYKVEEGSYANLLDTQEGGGSMPITNTSGYVVSTRYAPSGTQGQYFSFYFEGTLGSSQYGVDRPEIREMYAFGYRRSKLTDVIILAISCDAKALAANGIPQGRTSGEVDRLFRAWKRDQTVLQLELPDYETSRTVRVRVVGCDLEEIQAREGTEGFTQSVSVLNLQLVRDDLAGAYGNA